MRRAALNCSIIPLVFVLSFPSLASAQRVTRQGLSRVRVVRLSYVSGTVAVRRPGSTEWAQAVVNTPIEEGFGLETSAHGFAEVQFENGSTVRLGELSRIDFIQLAMDSQGNKLNRLQFEQGYATYHFVPEHHDVYNVTASGITLDSKGKSEFRTDLDGGRLRLEVFEGSVDTASASGSVRVGKDMVKEFDPDTTAASNLRHGIEKDAWDKWSDARDTQAQLTTSDEAVAMNRPFYGWDDLDEYGDWSYVPGFGYGWSPYEANGWLPFSAGLWNWYPSFGWTWISSEPWGWLPYHYGMWNYDASLGWFWMPGDFNMWSPGMVSWSMGPGWIGWTPYGAMLPAGYNGIVSVPGGVVQNGGAINSGTASRRPLSQGVRIAHPQFPAGRLAMLSGLPLPKGVELPEASNAEQAANRIATSPVHAAATRPGTPVRSAAGRTVSGNFVWHAVAAPGTVLMGGNAATEKTAFASHEGLWHRLTGAGQQPLHMRMGPTLGGHLPATGFDSRSLEAFHGAREFAGTQGLPGGRGASMPRNFGTGGFVMPHGGAMAARGGGTGVGYLGRGGTSGGMSGDFPGVMAPASSGVASPAASTGHGGGTAGGGGGHH